MRITLTRDLAYRAGVDEANRAMRTGGRKAWSEEDYAVAWQTFDGLWPLCEHQMEPVACWICAERRNDGRDSQT
jgi:hypothetical protein